MEQEPNNMSPKDGSPAHYVLNEGERAPTPRVRLDLFLAVTAFLLILAIILTYTLTANFERDRARKQLAEAYPPASDGQEAPNAAYMSAVMKLFSERFYGSDTEATPEQIEAMIDAYIAATGDRYACYYTTQEYGASVKSDAGQKPAMGVRQTAVTVMVSGEEIDGLQAWDILEDSPASRAGMEVGDILIAIGKGSERRTVSELGLEGAVAALKGEIGEARELTVLRPNGEDGYTALDMTVTLEDVTFPAVVARRLQDSPDAAQIFITGFDLTTPTSFCSCVDKMLAEGVKHFVFDLRDNGGGLVISVAALASYFLEEGDCIYSTKDKNETAEVTAVKVISEYTGIYASCNVSSEDIGKYRDLDVVLLVNGNTASAAELFTAALRDSLQTPIVGETTYGKGSMQSTILLSSYGKGLSGAVKLTVKRNYPPCGESYDGVGITPNQTVTLDPAVKSVKTLTEAQDAQLSAATAYFEK